MTISTGQYLTALLEAYGVDVVFGIPGVHTVELYRGLDGSSIRHVTPRHEQGAGFMADGYARVSGRPGVCFIITGPGMTNITTAMGQAYADSIPMLVISTVNSHGRMGSGEGWLHEMPDQRGMIEKVAAFSRTIHRPEELATALAQAFAVFEGARPRPVHLELPMNVMLASADHLPAPRRAAALARPAPAPDALAKARQFLADAKRPMILVGGGAVRAAKAVQALAEKLDAPVVMTTNARGLLPPSHPLAVSLTPSMPETRQLITQADVVLALGTEFGLTDYDFYEDGGFDVPGRLIRVDLDPVQIRRGPLADIGMIADANEAALALASGLAALGTCDGAARAAKAMRGCANLPVAMRGDLKMLEVMRDTLPDAVLVGDSTQLVYAGNTGFAAATPGSYFNSATGFGTLGYGLPAAIGAALAAPKRPVIALVGDGGLQFLLAELVSAVEAEVPVILMLHDNNGYGEIKSYMQSNGITPLGVDILTPDIAAIAAACGWKVKRPESAESLSDDLQGAAKAACPVMLIFGDELRQKFQQPFAARQ
ncbi:5-guanidino-2-oxopentanoate decarboxylase [Pseudorhodobacter sp.]|uniref:5-guanidino-2-oxopentanoate decarboxylase n=1 Tax=Pseudorhodobacter sp. TaxID=1934400 RepID=UPI002AFF6CD3|nr:5-guanidino-2-oxopentanoate decarboxylase [Pseudorhodobacter sp.]